MDREISFFIQHVQLLVGGITLRKDLDPKYHEICNKIISRYNFPTGEHTLNETDEGYIRRAIKRFNLLLKVDDDGNRVDISNKDNQLKIATLDHNSALSSMDPGKFFTDCGDIELFSGLPVRIIMESETDYKSFGFIVNTFLITEIILLRCDSSHPEYEMRMERISNARRIILNTGNENLALIEKAMGEINAEPNNINEAVESTKKMFSDAGLESCNKLVESIGSKLSNLPADGNFMSNVMTIASEVALQNGDALTELIQEPDKLHGIINSIMKLDPKANQDFGALFNMLKQ